MSVDEQKRMAAAHAAELVEEGMAVGLGSGSTAELAVHALGARFHEGLHFVGVPTSERTAALARSFGIPITTLEEQAQLDLVIDGADEVDPALNMIKGHGGALLREKIVARAAHRCVIVVDESKLVDRLGGRSPVPIEVVPFGWITTKQRLERLRLNCELRGGDDPYITDGRNYILDCHPSATVDFANPDVAEAIKLQTGVVEHGLFLGIATSVVVGRASGKIDVIHRPQL